MTKMTTAVPETRDSAVTSSAAVPVAVAGATGYAGQELLRLLARHPAVALRAAMSSGATSAPRALPALRRIWDGSVTPLDVDRLNNSRMREAGTRGVIRLAGRWGLWMQTLLHALTGF